MPKIKKVRIEKLSEKDEKNINGTMATPVGIKTKGDWHNGLIFSDDQLQNLREAKSKGDKIQLVFYKKDGYKNFKFPTETDKMKQAIRENRKMIKDLQATVQDFVTNK